MSGMHNYMRKLRWPLKDLEALKLTHGCWDSIPFYFLTEAKMTESALYPPCVYTDDPNYDPEYEDGCAQHGLCSFYFHGTLRELNLHRLEEGRYSLFNKGNHVVFDQLNGGVLRGKVVQVDRRKGSQREFFGSSWTYDILAMACDSSGEDKAHMCLFKHIAEWNVYFDEYIDDVG